MQDRSDGKKMIETDWRQEVVWICGPRLETDTRESWFARGAKKCGVQWRQLKALFHREVTDPKYSIGQRVKNAAAEARKEAIEHAGQLERLARSMECAIRIFIARRSIALSSRLVGFAVKIAPEITEG